MSFKVLGTEKIRLANDSLRSSSQYRDTQELPGLVPENRKYI